MSFDQQLPTYPSFRILTILRTDSDDTLIRAHSRLLIFQ